MVFFGDGVVVGNVFSKIKEEGIGWIVIVFGWGIVCIVVVYVFGLFSFVYLNLVVILVMVFIGVIFWG